jgi:Asp-tRNA(Asn)/Glu-tRNA(Gln) amidotransferase A subunit family amidase
VFGQDWPSSLTIAVPSRLYFKKTSNHPLAGLRFAVKDNTDLKGLRTGGSSRAYTRLRKPCLQSAAVVEALLDLGAVPVGKTKTTQFGDTEWATRDWVDYHAPFTPRADGYQGPSGSSSGSGAAMAAYDWLDFATGTDSCGSIRSPAAIEGLFAMRPSLGAAETNGLIPWSKHFDTFAFMTREIDLFAEIANRVYRQSVEPRPNSWLPKRLILPTEYWNLDHQETREVMEQFVRAVEAHLKVKRTELSLEDEWQKGNPVSTTEPLLEFFNMTLPHSYGADQRSFYETFAQDHEATFGVPPYFNPEGQFKMQWLPAMGREQQKQGLEEMSVFKKWFEESILQVDADGYPEAIVLLPWTFGEPDYRDVYREQPTWFGHGFHFYCISPFAQAPEIMVPVGQTSFQSKVTGCREWLPASVGVIGAHGTDRQLVKLIKDILHSTDLPTSTLTGFVAFEAGEPRRVTDAGLGLQKLLSWPWRT